jgi:hypothetical protein
MQVECRDIYGKTIEIDTDYIVGNSVQVGSDYCHLSKLFYENGTSCIDLAKEL